MKIYYALLIAFCLTGCGNPLNTPLPRDLEKMESVKSSIEKLKPEERELLTAYIVRKTIGAKFSAAFGGKAGEGIPEGMTFGTAIEEQRKFRDEVALEEARQKALKEKLQAEKEAALKAMREAITVALVSKRVVAERGMSGMVLDEKLVVTFGYKNNTDKEVVGVKGMVSIVDLFGDELSGFQISNDESIAPKSTVNWTGSRSLKYSFGNNKDQKLAELGDEKFKLTWEPQIILFKDGSKLAAPGK